MLLVVVEQEHALLEEFLKDSAADATLDASQIQDRTFSLNTQ